MLANRNLEHGKGECVKGYLWRVEKSREPLFPFVNLDTQGLTMPISRAGHI